MKREGERTILTNREKQSEFGIKKERKKGNDKKKMERKNGSERDEES